jgi:hypothetical protein
VPNPISVWYQGASFISQDSALAPRPEQPHSFFSVTTRTQRNSEFRVQTQGGDGPLVQASNRGINVLQCSSGVGIFGTVEFLTKFFVQCLFVNCSAVSQVFDIKIYRISIGSGQTKVNCKSAGVWKGQLLSKKKITFWSQ